MTAVPPRPAAPDATAGDGLREVERLMAFVREWDDGERNYWAIGEDITDLLRWWLPALRDVLAAAARDAEKVRRCEALAGELETIGEELHSIRAAEAYTDAGASLRDALDPS